MEEILLKLFDRKIIQKNDLSSIELVILMNELNSLHEKEVDIFSIIECKSIEEIEELYNNK